MVHYINHGSSSVKVEKGGSIGVDILTGVTTGATLVAKERNNIINPSISQFNTVQSTHHKIHVIYNIVMTPRDITT